MSEQRFYIASLKHTRRDHEHIVFWGKDHCGYTPVVGDYIGEYDLVDAAELNDGYDCIAVPVEEVEALLSPEPYFNRYGNDFRFYDQRGPVVDNTAEKWRALDAASHAAFPVTAAKRKAIKPATFRGRRRSFSLPTNQTEQAA